MLDFLATLSTSLHSFSFRMSKRKMKADHIWSWSVAGLIIFNTILVTGVMGFDDLEYYLFNNNDNQTNANVLMVGLTLVHSAAAKGAVCLDGSVPGYHLHRGFGLGANSWIIQLQGGAWCVSIQNCQNRKSSGYGSSTLMEKELPFKGILSNNATENPDFYNWNRVKVRYCDGASFSGDSENKEAQLQFRGKRIFLAVMEDLMSKGMYLATQTLLNGCSSGGLASILRCDDFKNLFPLTTKVKCMSDAGFFLHAVDIAGGHSLRSMYAGVVNTQGLQNTLPHTCTSHMDPTLCFFPQFIINEVKTPFFVLNSGFDSWQIGNSLAPPSADPNGIWRNCSSSFRCTPSQKLILEGFRKSMIDALQKFSMMSKNKALITSGWAHCQTERLFGWVSDNKNQGLSVAVGDWYFERTKIFEFEAGS